MDDVDFERVYFAGDRLRVLDRDTLERLRRPRWSPSSSKTMSKCPARWALGWIAGQQLSALSDAEEGTTAHWVLEQLMGLPAAQRTLERADEILASITAEVAQRHGLRFPEPGDYDLWIEHVRHRFAGLWWVLDPRELLVTNTEQRLETCSVAGVPFKGFIDLQYLQVDQGRVLGTAVSDYKTALRGAKNDFQRDRFGDDHGDQGRLYAIAKFDLDGRLPDRVEMLYTATGQRYVVSLTDDDLNRVASEFASSWERMHRSCDDGSFELGPSPLCRWCPAFTVCPAAPASDKPLIDGSDRCEQLGIGSREEDPFPRTVPLRGDNDEEIPMTALFFDDKRWIEHNNRPDAPLLNGESPTATSNFSLVALALETFAQAGNPSPHGRQVVALSQTFARLVTDVQHQVAPGTSTAAGINTRLRGALHTALSAFPVPFGADESGWETWADAVRRRMVNIASVSYQMWATPLPEQPWLALATPALPTAAAPAA